MCVFGLLWRQRSFFFLSRRLFSLQVWNTLGFLLWTQQWFKCVGTALWIEQPVFISRVVSAHFFPLWKLPQRLLPVLSFSLCQTSDCSMWLQSLDGQGSITGRGKRFFPLAFASRQSFCWPRLIPKKTSMIYPSLVLGYVHFNLLDIFRQNAGLYFQPLRLIATKFRTNVMPLDSAVLTWLTSFSEKENYSY